MAGRGVPQGLGGEDCVWRATLGQGRDAVHKGRACRGQFGLQGQYLHPVVNTGGVRYHLGLRLRQTAEPRREAVAVFSQGFANARHAVVGSQAGLQGGPGFGAVGEKHLSGFAAARLVAAVAERSLDVLHRSQQRRLGGVLQGPSLAGALPRTLCQGQAAPLGQEHDAAHE